MRLYGHQFNRAAIYDDEILILFISNSIAIYSVYIALGNYSMSDKSSDTFILLRITVFKECHIGERKKIQKNNKNAMKTPCHDI